MKKIPILLYHGISDSATPEFLPFTLSPAMFEKHMAYLREQSYTPMSVAQFVTARDAQQLPKKPVVITFDDGFKDFYIHALPILKRYEIPATMYVVAGYVGKTSLWLEPEGEGERPMMTWGQLRECIEAGVEIGAHTMTHPQLDLLSSEMIYNELHESKQTLEADLHQPVTTLAYPHGYHTSKVIKIAREVGFTSACAVKNALSVPDDDLFALARVTIFNDCTVEHLASVVEGEGVPLTWQHETLKTKVWRMVRRVKYHRLTQALTMFGLTPLVYFATT